MDGSATIGAGLRAGFSDVPSAARACWLALTVATLLIAGAAHLPPGASLVAALVASVIAQGALFRRAFARAPGLWGLRWGRDEWRLLGAQLLIVGLFALIGAILMVIVGGVALGVARTAAPNFDPGTIEGWKSAFASAGPAGLILLLAPLASLAILIWLSLRLAFAAPATVDQSGVRVLSAFPLTRGRAPTFFVVGLAIAAPVILARAALNLAPAPDTVAAALQALITYFYALPAWAAALVYFYRRGAVSRDA